MKKMFLMCAFLFVVFLLALPLMAQDKAGPFDPATVNLILAGFGGITVLGLTQMIKVWTKGKISPYIISAAISAGTTAFFLVKGGVFDWISFAGYTVLVFLSANGIYKATKTG